MTGIYTGRSPKDKYILKDNTTENNLWWTSELSKNDNKPIDNNVWNNLKKLVTDQLSSKKLYIIDAFCGANKDTCLKVRFVVEVAWQAHFVKNMFIRPSYQELKNFIPDFHVLNGSKPANTNFKDDGLNSETFIAFNLTDKIQIIGGSWYGGEMKKGMFSVMNYLLPQKNIASMHCSANTTGENTAIFFGLSGTGKTTLSADPKRALIGDDEHGWGANGVFNFEGGCYAKLIDLSEEDEPAIFGTTRKFGTVLENIVMDSEGVPNFTDTSKTQNTRGSYPIEFIENRTPDSKGGHPQNVIFLTCDAFGVLPPISRLTPDQAAYHFISGYTAKVAGTEVGVKEPQATFSACFGEPFMPMHPGVYADLLSTKIAEHGATAWLINTGWSGGAYGVGSRMKIRHTRAMLNAALDGDLDAVEYVKDERFGFEVPMECPNVPSEVLQPRSTWGDKGAFDATADKLAAMFNENFARYAEGVSEAVNASAPSPIA